MTDDERDPTLEPSEDQLSWKMSEGPPPGPAYDGKRNQRPAGEGTCRRNGSMDDPHPPGERLADEVEGAEADDPEPPEPDDPADAAREAAEDPDDPLEGAEDRGGYVRGRE